MITFLFLFTDDDSKTATEPTFARGEISGKVKLAIHYKSHALLIMVRHAVDLLALDKGQPDPYIKIYLLPDPHKQTKRKTRIQKKTSNPTYNEMVRAFELKALATGPFKRTGHYW